MLGQAGIKEKINIFVAIKKIAVEHIGKVCVDLGKLSLAILVLGTALKGEIRHAHILIAGATASLMLIGVGIILIVKASSMEALIVIGVVGAGLSSWALRPCLPPIGRVAQLRCDLPTFSFS